MQGDNRRIRCAFITGTFPALSEAFLINIVAGLIDNGIGVRVFANKGDRKAAHHSVYQRYDLSSRITYLPSFGPSNLARDIVSQIRTLGLSKFLRVHQDCLVRREYYKKARLRLGPILEFKPDVLYCNFVGTAVSYMFLRELGIVKKLVVGAYGGDVSIRNLKYPYRDVFGVADSVIAISNHITSSLISLGCNQAKIELIPLPVDPQEFLAKVSYEDRDTLHVLSVGRIVEKKGFLYGIRAVGNVVETGLEIVYTIVGDGPLRLFLREEIERLHLGGTVRLVGPKNHEELSAIYQDADILLVPSVTAANGDTEGQVVVLQEAGLVGLPVIASLHNGIPNGVKDGVTGFLVGERDVNAITSRLRTFQENRHLLKQMGIRHREFVLEKYSRHVISKQISRLIAGRL